MKQKQVVWELLIITAGIAICGVAIHFFLIPSHLSVGSISGLAVILCKFIPLPISAITLLCNAVLLLLGVLLIGREFGGKTIYAALLLPGVLWVLEQLFPNSASFTADPFLDMLCYIFLVSAGQAMIFVRNASTGGLDIVAKLLNKFFRMDLGRAVSLAGMCVALSSALLYDAKTVIISILGTYLNGIILDRFIFGFDLKRRVCILSPKVEELRKFILNDLHSGATLYEAEGAYNGTAQKEIVTIVNKQEYYALMSYVKKIDPTAFVTVYAVNEISYQPKRCPNNSSWDLPVTHDSATE